MINPVTVAISADCLGCLATIPRKEHTRIMDFIMKFRNDPTSPGINYEKIKAVKDTDLRSVRISEQYRGIIKKPEAGNVYLLLWVDKHDEAYAWASSKKCKVNPETGSIQVYDVVWEQEASATLVEPATSLFADISDRHLVKLGVPEELLPWVKAITSEEELDNHLGRLPQEAYESLFFLANGYSVDELLAQVEKPAEEIDANDFQAALYHLDSLRRFMAVDNDVELSAILNAPLEKWRVFLHSTQRKLVEQSWGGPVRVLGGAGTGKTVVAIHRAKFLAEKIYTEPSDRILFTTFTKNLAADIKEHLALICAPDVIARIEVVNLDRWVAAFLKQQGFSSSLLLNGEASSYWEQALSLAPVELGLSDEFYREEWELVVQPQEITTLDGYLKASRIGRGTRVDRKARKEIWPVFEEYRLLTQAADKREPADAMRDARLLIENGQARPSYRAILIDEVQDMSVQALRLLRTIAGEEHENDLFLVGDAHQRIYRYKAALVKCGINVRGRSRKLRINYRTTDEIRKWAVGLLHGLPIDDLDGGLDDQRGYKALLHGHPPMVQFFASPEEEIRFLTQYFKKIDSTSWKDCCLVARTKRLIEWYEEQLKAAGIDVYLVDPDSADDRRTDGVRLATMHRVKGLEFDRVVIAAVNEGVVPLPVSEADSNDAVVRESHEIRERALLYVAATRAKKEVVITSCGKSSQFLE